jgi:hypothetical protein
MMVANLGYNDAGAGQSNAQISASITGLLAALRGAGGTAPIFDMVPPSQYGATGVTGATLPVNASFINFGTLLEFQRNGSTTSPVGSWNVDQAHYNQRGDEALSALTTQAMQSEIGGGSGGAASIPIPFPWASP